MAGMFDRLMGRLRSKWTPESTAGSDFFTTGAGQGSMAGFGSEAPVSNMDETTLKEMMANAPEIQRRQRRVEQLRAMQEEGQQRAADAGEFGSLMPTQKGGLYQTVARWNPNYGAMADRITGAVSDYATGNMAEGEAQGLDKARAREVMRGVQQFSGGPMGVDVPMELPGAANLNMMGRGRSLNSWFQP